MPLRQLVASVRATAFLSRASTSMRLGSYVNDVHYVGSTVVWMSVRRLGARCTARRSARPSEGARPFYVIADECDPSATPVSHCEVARGRISVRRRSSHADVATVHTIRGSACLDTYSDVRYTSWDDGGYRDSAPVRAGPTELSGCLRLGSLLCCASDSPGAIEDDGCLDHQRIATTH